MRVYGWNPYHSGEAVLRGIAHQPLNVFERHAASGVYHGWGFDDLYELTIGPGSTERTVGAARDGFYRGTVAVPIAGKVYATTADQVYVVDPATGSGELVGHTPSEDLVDGITWDPETDRLGFVIDDEVRWTARSAPWHSAQEFGLNGTSIRKLAYSPQHGVFYGVGPDGLFTVTFNEGNPDAATIEVSATAPPDMVKGWTWKDGALWAATKDDRLYRVDPNAGTWTEVASQRFGYQGLY